MTDELDANDVIEFFSKALDSPARIRSALRLSRGVVGQPLSQSVSSLRRSLSVARRMASVAHQSRAGSQPQTNLASAFAWAAQFRQPTSTARPLPCPVGRAIGPSLHRRGRVSRNGPCAALLRVSRPIQTSGERCGSGLHGSLSRPAVCASKQHAIWQVRSARLPVGSRGPAASRPLLKAVCSTRRGTSSRSRTAGAPSAEKSCRRWSTATALRYRCPGALSGKPVLGHRPGPSPLGGRAGRTQS